MLRSIFGTTLSRLAVTFFGFLIVVTNARYIGAEGVGTIGLIILAITINILLSNFLGASMVYLVPRQSLFRLFFPSYVWAVITAVAGTLVQYFCKMIPEGYAPHVFFLSLLASLAAVNLNILLGKERIKTYNYLAIIENFIKLAVLLLFIFILEQQNVMSFIEAFYVSSVFSFLCSLWMIRGLLREYEWKGFREGIREMLRFGSMTQLAAVFQLFNYRMAYYLIVHFLGKASLGIFSVGVQIAESVWIIGRSVSLVQYTRISNSDDMAYCRQLTLVFFKFTFVVTALAVVVLALIPGEVFAFVFRKDFSMVGMVVGYMGVGIVAVAVSMMFSHYFSGTGRPVHNTINSAIGMVFTLGFGLWLIPRYGLKGAAVTASVAYTMGMLYQMIVFMAVAKVRLKEFLFNNQDFSALKGEMKNLFVRKGK